MVGQEGHQSPCLLALLLSVQPRMLDAFAARQPTGGFSFAIYQEAPSLQGLQCLNMAASGAGDTNNHERQGLYLSRGCTGLFSQGTPLGDAAWGNTGCPNPHLGHHSQTQTSEGSNSPPLMDPAMTTAAVICLAFCPGPAQDYSSSSKQNPTQVSLPSCRHAL